MNEIRVVIGAGPYVNNPNWIHTQEEELNLLDEKTWQSRFGKGSIKAILAEHVWEHLTYEEGLEAAKICLCYLQSSGYIRCAVPDGYFPDEAYQNIVKVGGPGPEEHSAASHKIVYNYKSLTKMFEAAGFKVKLLEYFDEEGNFHLNAWEGADGFIFRSKKYDPRNQGEKIVAPSLIIDAIKL
ncbi:class I SAM-dependent methyltransferase [Terribacillus saccharophilus]|uniref:SAM-dependent methyltransferase n=1 Tax=Terribacillus saccharophilus TaxID=361277 RepID=A0ABX4H3T9_9BACI|nr:SAM-dependent methyltransferase [Terribacillus saccharophilus]PAD34152.1 SAM-dependent methyltransferase [Terribacillus saccharophilus]PAD98036.1 SAM-dependent methyltransferase [Terribacillus saccharophilus]PAE01812.1 SAM-dependent methyltransferase [Terribacillus saccharophilus]